MGLVRFDGEGAPRCWLWQVDAQQVRLGELRADNLQLTRNLRSTHELCERHNDVATASLIENWIDQTERRTSFLTEIVAEC